MIEVRLNRRGGDPGLGVYASNFATSARDHLRVS
jgi:hypothetical protein